MDPSLCSGLQKKIRSGLQRKFFLHDSDALFKHIHRDVRLLFGDDERRRDANRVLTRTQEQDTALECQLDDAIALLMGFGASLLVGDDLHTSHQTPAAHGADDGLRLYPVASSF